MSNASCASKAARRFEWTPAALDALDQSVLLWLATVDGEGWPNVSPKEIFCPWSSRQLLIAHIASPGSVRNIEQHGLACASCVDVFAQKGLKFQGPARVVWPSAPDFDTLAEPLRQKAGPRFPIHAVIDLHIEQVQPLLAPSLQRAPDTDALVPIDAAWQSYMERLHKKIPAAVGAAIPRRLGSP